MLQSAIQHPVIPHTPQQAIYHTQQQALQHMPNSQHMVQSTIQPSHNIDKKLHDENIYYVCTLCETPTKFTNYGKLEKHVRRFHSDFNQNERGSKRKRIKEGEVFPKKAKWNWA